MILKEIVNRRSCRSYKPDLVPDEHINEVIKAAQFAPNAKHNQSIEFIVIKDSVTKEKLREILNQDFIKEAPVIIVPVIDTTKSVLPIQDLSIASGYMFLQATSLGLGTVWKNVWDEQREKIKELLNIPASFLLINVIPVGYPKEELPLHTNADFSKERIRYERMPIV